MVERVERTRELCGIIRRLREELEAERAYGLQLRLKAVRDLRELRALRAALHDLERRPSVARLRPKNEAAAKLTPSTACGG